MYTNSAYQYETISKKGIEFFLLLGSIFKIINLFIKGIFFENNLLINQDIQSYIRIKFIFPSTQNIRSLEITLEAAQSNIITLKQSYILY